jgi:hypothetical protein
LHLLSVASDGVMAWQKPQGQGIKANNIAHKAFKPRPKLLDQGLCEAQDKHLKLSIMLQ